MVLRPDEEANLAEIERDKSFRSNIKSGLKTAGGIVSGAAIAQISPFLSPYLSSDIAMKGLQKVSPKLADFLQKGKSMGLKVEEGLQYIKDALQGSPEQASQQPPQQSTNIIKQYSPELYDFLEKEIQSGRSPDEAGALAQMEKKGGKGFKSIIDKIVKDHKAPWSAILQTVFGSTQMAQPQQSAPQAQIAPAMATQPAQGGGQARLMEVLQKLQQMRSGK